MVYVLVFKGSLAKSDKKLTLVARYILTPRDTPVQYALFAGIAQLVEHDLAKVGVASSNLVSRSIFKWIEIP